jgi:hypothetical protein
MANLPETATYDAGVYQIETTDAVIGGVDGIDNAGARNLANRTAYLKAHVDLMETIVSQVDAEARVSTILKGWTAQRVGQAIAAGITALVVQATESVLGIAKIATQSQTNAGSNDATIVTPLKLRYGVSYSLVASGGYIIFPSWLGGLIIQWGNKSETVDTDGLIGFPVSYPHACLTRMVFNDDAGTSDPATIANNVMTCFDAMGTDTFKWKCVTAATGVPIAPLYFCWFSIGY